MTSTSFLLYLAVMAGVTYAVRLIPLLLCKKKIKNQFIRSFLFYIPYAVLGAMTIPAVFYATGNKITAVAGFVTAVVLSWRGKSLLVVAACASVAVFLCNLFLHV